MKAVFKFKKFSNFGKKREPVVTPDIVDQIADTEEPVETVYLTINEINSRKFIEFKRKVLNSIGNTQASRVVVSINDGVPVASTLVGLISSIETIFYCKKGYLEINAPVYFEKALQQLRLGAIVNGKRRSSGYKKAIKIKII